MKRKKRSKAFVRKKAHIIYQMVNLMEQKQDKHVTVKEICEAAGISVGSFYHYFPSKDNVVDELYEISDYYFEEELEWIERGKVGAEQVKRFLKAFSDFIVNWGYFANALIMRNIGHDPNSIPPSRKAYTILNDIIHQGIAKKQFRSDLDVHEISGLIWIFIRGTLLEWYKEGREFPVARVLEEGGGVLLDGLANHD